MLYEDMRNTLIVEMSKHSNQTVPWFQGQDDATLAGRGPRWSSCGTPGSGTTPLYGR